MHLVWDHVCERGRSHRCTGHGGSVRSAARGARAIREKIPTEAAATPGWRPPGPAKHSRSTLSTTSGRREARARAARRAGPHTAGPSRCSGVDLGTSYPSPPVGAARPGRARHASGPSSDRVAWSGVVGGRRRRSERPLKRYSYGPWTLRKTPPTPPLWIIARLYADCLRSRISLRLSSAVSLFRRFSTPPRHDDGRDEFD